MKGALKAMKRTPHMLTSRVGMSSKSQDAEFNEVIRKFTALEELTTKLIKDSSGFRDSVDKLLSSTTLFLSSFSTLFQPLTTSDTPPAPQTWSPEEIQSYSSVMAELRENVAPEIELIDSRVIAPLKEYEGVLKKIRKGVTKRDHKLVDYDRFNNSYTKLRDKKEKTLNDEKNLFKLEQDFEQAAQDYDHINTLLKTEMPQFFEYTQSFITPLFTSFYYMQLNILYVMLEKTKSFAGEKFDLNDTDVEGIFARHMGDAQERLDALNITKRFVSTARLMQTHRVDSTSSAASPTSLRPKPSTLSTNSSTSSKLAGKSSLAAASPSSPSEPAPPPYSPSGGTSPGGSASGSATKLGAKKPPPPPPPGKPKPKAADEVKYVVALYDFAAQAEGDLSFNAGDQIELVQRTDSTEDWWTGKLNGVQGVFPGNYVQET